MYYIDKNAKMELTLMLLISRRDQLFVNHWIPLNQSDMVNRFRYNNNPLSNITNAKMDGLRLKLTKDVLHLVLVMLTNLEFLFKSKNQVSNRLFSQVVGESFAAVFDESFATVFDESFATVFLGLFPLVFDESFAPVSGFVCGILGFIVIMYWRYLNYILGL
eukprot:237984_1